MKIKKAKKRIQLITGLIVLFALALASIPASAQPGTNQPPPPTPLAAQASSTLYLPLITRQVNTDLTIGAFEVTQATQNLNNTVSLVAGKPTVVRVYAQNNTADAISGVVVSISATRGGSNLPGSPMTSAAKSVTNSWSRSDLNTSFNFTLPTAWLTGSVTLQIRVDPNNTIPERDNANNLRTFAANFNSVPALDVKVVPIYYTDPGTQITYPAASSGFLSAGVVKMFPISSATVSERAAIGWSQNLRDGSAWSNLLRQILTIKNADNAPASQIYYGLVPFFSEDGFSTWFPSRGGIVGIGYVGLRVSVGLADASNYGIFGSEIANHEFGHNLGREHSPCDAPDPDLNYPYTGGLIGQHGLRVDRMTLYDPSIYVDIMSYCDPAWISDYTYQGLYNDQAARGAMAPINQSAVESLLVRADLLEDGTIRIHPVYTFTGIPDALPEESDYTVELIDEQGAVITSYPIQVLHAEEEEITIQALHAMLPAPEKPFATLRITKKGEVLAVKNLTPTSQQPLEAPTIQASEQGAVLQWSAADTPAVVRYTQDDGESWATLAVDYLGGQLILDEQALPEGTLHFEIILADQAASSLALDWENTR